MPWAEVRLVIEEKPALLADERRLARVRGRLLVRNEGLGGRRRSVGNEGRALPLGKSDHRLEALERENLDALRPCFDTDRVARLAAELLGQRHVEAVAAGSQSRLG